jgi:hypothetical protein
VAQAGQSGKPRTAQLILWSCFKSPLKKARATRAFFIVAARFFQHLFHLSFAPSCTEHMRIVRRLDFTKTDRITATCREHAKILSETLCR